MSLQSKQEPGAVEDAFLTKALSSHFMLSLSGGMPFIEAPTSISSASSEAASTVVSPCTDSGLELSSQATSKEDLTDLEQAGSPREITTTEPGSTEIGVSDQLDPQVFLKPLFSSTGYCRNWLVLLGVLYPSLSQEGLAKHGGTCL